MFISACNHISIMSILSLNKCIIVINIIIIIIIIIIITFIVIY